MVRPDNVQKLINATDVAHAVGDCPVCALHAILDIDQFHGRVSIQCPNCDYHETHDLSKLENDKDD